MGRVTSKLQVTVPKIIADRFLIKPGDEIDWIPAGDTIRVVTRPMSKRHRGSARAERLRLFDEATARLGEHAHQAGGDSAHAKERGWTREDLYQGGRGRPR